MTTNSTIPPDRTGRRLLIQRFVPVFLVACVPVAVALCNDEWLFTPAGESDPWWYVGAGYQFDNPQFGESYKVSRLPWILAQFAARQILAPAPAAYFLTLGFLVPGAIGFYLAARRLFGTGGALAGTVLLNTYTYYLVSRATDYHNTSAGPFYIWSFLLATMGAQSDRHSRGLFFLSGIFFGLSVHSGFTFLFLAPCLLVHLWLLKRSNHDPRLWVSVATGASGAMAVTVGLGLINAGFGRGFFFFLPQLNYIAELATPQGQEYLNFFYRDGYLSGVYGASPSILGMRHLTLPFVATLVALWLAAASMRALRRSTEVSSFQWFTLSASLQMLLASAIWGLQEARHGLGLVIDFASYPLIFPAFLVVSSGFSRIFGSGRLSAVWHVLIAAAAAAPLVYNGWVQEVVGPWLLPSWPAVAPFLFYGGSLLAIALLGRHARTPVVGVALVAVFGVGHAFSIHQSDGLLRSGEIGLRVADVQSHARRDQSLSVVDLHLRLSKAGLDRVHLWWDETETFDLNDGSGGSRRLENIGTSTTRTGVREMWDSNPAPGIDQIPADYLQKLTKENSLVAVITISSETADRMLARLREWGEWRLLSEETINQGGIRFQLIWLGSSST